MNQALVVRLNSFFVACYKALGFVVLGAVLVALVSYLGVHAFFFASESWIAPIIISSSDEEVIRLYAHAASQQAEREQALALVRELQLRLADAQRTLETERRFQERFLQALEGDRRLKAQELATLQEILRKSQEVREQIEISNRAYTAMARKRATDLLSARLVDREEYITLEHQLAQMARTNLSLAESEAGLRGRISDLYARSKALESIVTRSASARPSLDVVLVEREFLKSALALARAEEEEKALRENLEAARRMVEAHDEILRSIRNAPRIRAIEGQLTVAFVPYENLENAQPGEPVYGCALGVVLCKRVGYVVDRLDGEVTSRHPVRNKIVRGVLVEVEFEDLRWAEEEVLHVGGRPLFL